MTICGDKIATIGVFDGVHTGHRWLLSQLRDEAARRGLVPAVITFDRHPLSLINPAKAPELLMPATERLAELRNEQVEVICFDFTTELRHMSAHSFMKMLSERYDVKTIMMGFNHHFGSDCLDDFNRYVAIGRELGIDIVKAHEYHGVENVSSSAIRQAIAEGHVDRAAEMLGRPYRLSGKVVEGHAIGRKLGFPTANIEPAEHEQLLPPVGAYAVDIVISEGMKRRGILNIGYRPTIDQSDKPLLSIEVHIIDWSGNLYNHRLNVDFIRRLRDEIKFGSVQQLARQLEADCKSALTD